MKVTDGEFEALIWATLDEFKLPETEQELLDLLLPLRGEIVELTLPETGTPLRTAISRPPLG